MQEKVDELQMELDSTKLDLEHAQLSAKENEAAARALRFARVMLAVAFGCESLLTMLASRVCKITCFLGVDEMRSLRRFYICMIGRISVHPVSPHVIRSAAGGSSGDGSVDVKMLAEQNVQLKEALKRLHSHSIAEKTDVSALVWTRVVPRRMYRNVCH